MSGNQVLDKNNLWKWLLSMVVIFLSLIIILTGIVLIYQYSYQSKVYAGIKLDDFDLGGKTKAQAKALVQAKIDKLATEGIEFYFEDYKYTLQPIISAGTETGLAFELWTYTVEEEVEKIYSIGREGNWLHRTKNQLYFLLNSPRKEIGYKINNNKIKEILKENFKNQESPGQDAKLDFGEQKIDITQETAGEVFDYNLALEKIEDNLRILDNKKIEMKLIVHTPQVTREKSLGLLGQVELTLGAAPLTLAFEKPEYYQGRKYFDQSYWYISKAELKKWLKIKYDDSAWLGVDAVKVTEYLEKVAVKINTPAQNAKFGIKDGKVSEWQSSQDGFILNIEETIKIIENEFIRDKNSEIKLILSPDKSKITNDNVNDLGIKELIGIGESNFAGSPRNRQHNISVGADTLNGILIKPNEEFSLITTLGEIDAEAGYKPELVIKEGKTIPEYGGGLCQIGTTLFRLAINTGLPITERRNHSYRVGYYEPAGTDATIYNPWPDLKFINDTDEHLLLQTRIEGNNLIFEFWGTSDGREVETTDPAIYNIKAPPTTRYVKTDELKPGEKRLLEHAHNGADAHFQRTIIWPEESKKEPVEEVWSSHYVPWQEVYLIGKTASSTEESAE